MEAALTAAPDDDALPPWPFADGSALAAFLPLPPDFALALFAALPDLPFFGFASLPASAAFPDAALVFPDAALAGLAAVPPLAFALAAEPEAARAGDDALAAGPLRRAAEAREAGDAVAADIDLAASDSAVTAVSIALVATAMARSALVIVLAESVAWAAAVFSLAAAFVARVAADETARGVAAEAVLVAALPVEAVDAARRRVLVPVPVARVALVRVPAGRVAGLAVVVPPALALGRAGFAAAVFVGTELPPSQSVTGTLIPR